MSPGRRRMAGLHASQEVRLGCQAGDRLGGRWVWASEGCTHHRPHVSCFSLLPRRSWQALCTNPGDQPSNSQPCHSAPHAGPSPPSPLALSPLATVWQGAHRPTQSLPLRPCPPFPAHLEANGSWGPIESSCPFIAFGSKVSLGAPRSRLPVGSLERGQGQKGYRSWAVCPPSTSSHRPDEHQAQGQRGN